jgi:DNA-binding NtrC family response regulator
MPDDERDATIQSRQILIVDDEPLMRDFLCETLSRKDYDVDTASDGSEAIRKIKERIYDLVLTDLKMPNVSGMEVLEAAKKRYAATDVVVITAYGTIETAVDAMKKGASDYVTKPFSADAIEIVVDKIFEKQSLVNENAMLRQRLDTKRTYDIVVGKSSKMLKVIEAIEFVAPTKATILIQGESGTGKELVARAVHTLSPRKEKPFIRVNCAALPEGIIESELFGHERGAFTGAVRRTKGRFELAHGGTMLLDEISETSPSLQAKLLRILQEREFERVGSGDSIKVDVRIIATTNRDLKERIRENEFREDLFYRLNVVPIWLPPLRERKEDIPVLAEHFLRKYNEESGKRIEGFSEEAMDKLLGADWPGNVRELENCIERAVVMATQAMLKADDLVADEIGWKERSLGSAVNSGITLKEAEKRLILKTLESHEGNRTRCAEALGISVRTLRNKLNEYESAGEPVR